MCSVYVGFHTLSCFDRVRVPSSTEVMGDDRERAKDGMRGGGKGVKTKRRNEKLTKRRGDERVFTPCHV